MEQRTLVSRTLWWSALFVMGGAFAACGSDDPPSNEPPRCVLETKDKRVSTVRCGDELAVDVWREENEDHGCYVASGERSDTPVIQCGEFTVKLNDGCPDGFVGDVAFGNVPSTMSVLSATAFSLSDCKVLHGSLWLDSFSGQPLEDTLGTSALPINILRVSSATVPRFPSVLTRLETVGGDLLLTRIDGLKEVELSSLTRVEGGLRVERLISVETLSFPLLRVVGESLWVDNNLVMKTVDISSLERLGGTLRVVENDALTVLTAPKLHALESAVRVRDNPALAGVSLPALIKVPTYLRVHDNLVLETVSLDALEEVGEQLEFFRLPNMGQVTLARLITAGALNIYELPTLREIALKRLTRVEGDLMADDLGKLESVTVPALAHIGGALRLEGALGAHTLAFPALETLGSLLVRGAVGLKVVVMPVLENVAGALELSENAGMLSVAQEGETVFRVGGDVTVVNNEELLDVCFDRINHIGGALRIEDNPRLQQINSVAETIGGEVTIVNNGVLTIDFHAAIVAKSIELRNNTLLTTINCPFLEEVDETLSICDNPQLSGGEVPVLWRVGHRLEIKNNPQLAEAATNQICSNLIVTYGCVMSENGP